MGVGLYLTGRCRAVAEDTGGLAGRGAVMAPGARRRAARESPDRARRPGQSRDRRHPASLRRGSRDRHPRARPGRRVGQDLGGGARLPRLCLRPAAAARRRPGHHLGRAGPCFGRGDDAGYFHTGDARVLEDEFLHWLREVAKIVVDGLEKDYQWLMISMAIGHHYRHHGPLVTPMGPRGLDWLRAVVEDPRRGIDLFPWWAPGMGAPFYLGRALARMWRDVRWRAPISEDEGRLLMDVHLDLARAYRLDASLDYPWRRVGRADGVHRGALRLRRDGRR